MASSLFIHRTHMALRSYITKMHIYTHRNLYMHIFIWRGCVSSCSAQASQATGRDKFKYKQSRPESPRRGSCQWNISESFSHMLLKASISGEAHRWPASQPEVKEEDNRRGFCLNRQKLCAVLNTPWKVLIPQNWNRAVEVSPKTKFPLDIK